MAVDSKQIVPHHLACILDGNRRWACSKNKDRWEGHQAGVEPVRYTIAFCISHGIKHLSLYVLSIENLQRSKQEHSYLLNLLASGIENEYREWKQRDIRIKFVGDRSLFSVKIRHVCDTVEQATSACTTLTVYILLYYGGKQEIVASAKRIAHRVEAGELRAQDVDEKSFMCGLWMRDAPPVDLLIRTGGRCRLSNFLLFHSAYSELYFLDCFWPDLTPEHLQQALNYYQAQQRTFGV